MLSKELYAFVCAVKECKELADDLESYSDDERSEYAENAAWNYKLALDKVEDAYIRLSDTEKAFDMEDIVFISTGLKSKQQVIQEGNAPLSFEELHKGIFDE